MNNKIGYEENLVSAFFFFFFWESKVGNQGSVTFEIRMQELETWRKLPFIHYTLPLPPPPSPTSNYTGMYGAKGECFNFGLQIKSCLGSKTLATTLFKKCV